MLVFLNNVIKNFISLPTYVKEIHLLFLLSFVFILFPSFQCVYFTFNLFGLNVSITLVIT
jgi:hypothetical protein